MLTLHLLAVQAAPVRLELPSGPSAMAPSWAVDGGRLWLSWIEPGEEGGRLRLASFDGRGFGEPVTVVDRQDLLTNWADFPSFARGGDGQLYGWYPKLIDPATYAYDAVLLRSPDGLSWTELGPLHADGVPAEHGFVSLVAAPEGVRAWWLDGREVSGGGATALRTRLGNGPEEVADPRVCDCCGTAAVEGLVLYRDRSDEEIRDVAWAAPGDGGWSGAPLAGQGWTIAGCPVNGPALAEGPSGYAAAWYTQAEAPTVWSAIGPDPATWTPVLVDSETRGRRPLGRVDVAWKGDRAVVAWLREEGDQAVVLVRTLSTATGLGPEVEVGRTAANRSAGFPRLALLGEHVFLAWTDVQGDEVSLALARLELDELD